ncbi:MAG: hypothetical protein M1816_004238 [Peltula sp. TS41687]|nr:MAG: hypothetical protein M1816_004238 [Peltula sp. TS41687]
MRHRENAFSLKHNKERCLPPTREIREGPAISSREPTPACEQSDNDHCNYEHTHRLRLTIEGKSKDPTKGYAFGTNEQRCYVLLGPGGARGTSGIHFHITFDVIGGDKCFVLRDSSTNGTAVSYNRQASREVRHHFTWILNLKKKEGEWDIKVHVRGLWFKVELPSHETCKVQYELSRTADPPLGVLSIDSYTTTAMPSQSLTPGQRPIYIHEVVLGSGSFGQVDRVIDVSTGAIYAHKEFYEPSWAKDGERRKCQREQWRNKIRREIRIMMEHPHPDLKTFCGTEQYAAPEVYMGKSYTTAVDLWSLGVIMLKYIYGPLTQPPQARKRRINAISAREERGPAWCRHLVDYANDWDLDVLIDLLTTRMLRMEPRERLSADACLRKAYDLGLFDNPSVPPGGATLTQQTTLESSAGNEEGSPPIIVGAIWDAERKCHDIDGQAGRSASDHHSVISTTRHFGAPRPPQTTSIAGHRLAWSSFG